MDAKMENVSFYGTEHNDSDAIGSRIYHPRFRGKLIYSLILLISTAGMIGNGTVIRILSFLLKRNSFTVYILNLAVADSGTLIFLFLTGIVYLTTRKFPLEITECLICTYCTGQFLLTIISIDRFLALFFPIWYRCHQPPYLSNTLCTITWIICILLSAINSTLFGFKWILPHFHILICMLLCIPLMVVSSLALFIKGYMKSRMQMRGKLLKAILLALFLFLIFSIPPSAIYFIFVASSQNYSNLLKYGYLCACLNSSVNPLIYFLLGRKDHHSSFNLKLTLQTVFKEENESEEQSEVQVNIQL